MVGVGASGAGAADAIGVAEAELTGAAALALGSVGGAGAVGGASGFAGSTWEPPQLARTSDVASEAMNELIRRIIQMTLSTKIAIVSSPVRLDPRF